MRRALPALALSCESVLRLPRSFPFPYRAAFPAPTVGVRAQSGGGAAGRASAPGGKGGAPPPAAKGGPAGGKGGGGAPAPAPASTAAAAPPPPHAAFVDPPPYLPNFAEPSRPETLRVQLRLKAFHKFYLNRYVFLLAERFRELGLPPPAQVFLPKRTELYTVLRSPHVDKKHRDQFIRVTHKRLITFTLPRDSQAIELAYRLLSTVVTLAPGVEVRAKYASTMGLRPMVK
jgi:small subunit ribosomal protein S10